jgi:hypothetical protein
MQFLTQNSELKQIGVYAWTLPAHWVTLSDGKKFNTCPNAGICGAFCYAKSGRWLFSNVKAAHLRKLEMLLNDPELWEFNMTVELHHKRYAGKMIRIHDGGDFFSADYLQRWIRIAKEHRDKHFYSYTKEVLMVKAHQLPKNLTIIFSLGGRQDHFIIKDIDRHAEVFPTLAQLEAAGYTDIADDDRLAALSENHRIGLVSNNIPHLKKKQGDQTFGEWANKKKNDSN